jgi:septal ring factor EnvC (AmiA/AmiB activator)
MSDREPLGTEGSPLAANPDDAKGYRRGGGPRPRQPASTGGRSIGMSLVLAVLVAGLVVAGWFIASQHQALRTAESALTDSQRRLAVLEERLQITDQTMSDADKEVVSQLGVWQDEVRKLWDVVNKRNRGWIEENRANIKKHDAVLASIDASMKELKASVGRHESTLTQQAALAEQLAAVEQQLRQMTNQQRQATDQLNAVRQTVSGLESGLSRRVTETEKAVQAIDAYRLQLNSRLVDLQTRVDRLSVPPAP